MKPYRAKANIHTMAGMHAVGDTVLLSDEDAKRMIAEGTAEELPAESTKPAEPEETQAEATAAAEPKASKPPIYKPGK